MKTRDHVADPARRRFLKTSAGAASGLVIAFYVDPGPGAGLLAAEKPQGEAKPPALPPANAFLHIAPDGSVKVLLAHSEMGQGIWTSLPMLIAEELGCQLEALRIEHAPAAPVYGHTAWGVQLTGGSTTTWSEFDRYRQVGAIARDLLVRAAARKWKVDPAKCRVEKGHVVHGQERLGFGALAEAAAKLEPPAAVTLKAPGDWTLLGKPTRRFDSPGKVTGQAEYGLDVKLPGLLTGVVLRSPVFGGKLKGFDPERALEVPGVKGVYPVPSGVAVVGESFWAASEGRRALKAEWDEGPGAALDTTKLAEDFRARAREGGGAQAAAAGDVKAALAKARSKLEAEFEGPYLAHAPMEPLNCTVRIGEGKCEIWTGTQAQGIDQPAAAQAAGLKPEQVELRTTFLGGGFGRRASPVAQFVTEAVHVAKAAGAPVKTVWTREDDVQGGWYRPQWHHRVTVGFDDKGAPIAWQHAIVTQSIMEGTPFAAMIRNGVDGTSVEGAADSPYLERIPNHLVELHSPKLPVPVLWWRSVGHTHTAFVMETLVDDLARRAGKDAVAYRRELLKGTGGEGAGGAGHPRHLGVLGLAAEKAGWGRALPEGRARGVAVHESFGSYVALVVEVSVEGGRIRVHRAVAAIDCGLCVNPETVRSQLEGAIAFGLSAALHSEVTLKGGRVEQSNFHDYKVLRLSEMPEVESHIVPGTEKPGGVGEPGVPVVAPAVSNAVFALTGRRLRRLPLRAG